MRKKRKKRKKVPLTQEIAPMSYLDIATTALRELRERPPQPEPSLDPTAVDAFADMTLDDFATAGLVVEIYSEILGQDVLFVSDNVADEDIEAEGRVTYRAAELRKLESMRPSADGLKSIHTVKDIFGGSVVEIVSDPEPEGESA